jgi:hypothetical protein
MRQCEECGEGTLQGYIYDGSDVYCSDECLSTVASPEKWDKLHDEDPDYFYWTTFEDDDDHYCPDLNEWGEIDTGRNPGGDYLDTDFT